MKLVKNMALENNTHTTPLALVVPVQSPEEAHKASQTDQEEPTEQVQSSTLNTATTASPYAQGILLHDPYSGLLKENLHSESNYTVQPIKKLAIKKSPAQLFHEYLLMLLGEADEDGDGKISFDEMKKLIQKINKTLQILALIFKPTDEESVAKLLADVDKDGIINEGEKEHYEDIKTLLKIAYSAGDLESKIQKILEYFIEKGVLQSEKQDGSKPSIEEKLEMLFSFYEPPVRPGDLKDTTQHSGPNQEQQNIDAITDSNSLPIPKIKN